MVNVGKRRWAFSTTVQQSAAADGAAEEAGDEAEAEQAAAKG